MPATRIPLLSIVISGLLAGMCVRPSQAQTQPATQPAQSPAEGPPATQPALLAQGSLEPLRVESRLVDRPDEVVATLSNGLRVICKQYKVAPVVAVRMYVRTGSIYEDPRLGAGLSHLFEHLLSGGTTHRRTEEQNRRILLEIGGESNAYTTYDHTCYYITTVSKHLDTAVDLLADWITRAAFPDEEFYRELGVVQRELERLADDPERQLHESLMQVLFAGHPARFPVIGSKAALQTLTKADVVGYWRERYVPDNVIVSICGDIEVDKALDIVMRHFADFRRRPLDLISLPEAPRIVSPRGVTRRMEVNAAIVSFAWPSIDLTHPDLYALDLASFILTAGPSARLPSQLVYRERLAAGVSGASWTPEWARGVFDVTVRCPIENLVKVRQAVLEAASRLRDEPAGEKELAKAKRLKVAEYVQGLQTVASVASMMAADLMSTGDPHFSADYVERIQHITAEDIQRVARTYLDPRRLTTVLVAPHEASLAEWQAATREKTIEGPGPVRMVRLDNGLRVLLQANPATPTVSIQLYALGGLLAENANNNGISNLMAEASLRGTETRTGDQIAEFLDSQGAALAADAGSNTLYYRAQVLAESLNEVLEVFADVVLHPAFSEQAVSEVREPILDAIRRIDEDWRSELFHVLKAEYFGQHPYGLEPIGRVESVGGLTPEDLRVFHDKVLVGGNCVLAIFGDIDEPAVQQRVRELFGAMPAGDGPSLAGSVQAGSRDQRIFVKPKSPDRKVAGVGVAFPSAPFTAVEPRLAMTVLTTIVSGYRLPSGWLYEALRGGTNRYAYEAAAINWTGLRGGYVPIYAGCQPEQVNQVISIILDNMARARDGRFEPDEFQRAKGLILAGQLLGRQSNAQRATEAALDELYGLGYDFADKLAEAIDRIDAARVRAAAAKYLQDPVIVVVTPEPRQVRIEGFETVVKSPATQPGERPGNR